MKIGGRNLPDTIHLKHWLTVASNTARAQRPLEDELQKTAQLMLDASEKLTAELSDALIKSRVQRMARLTPILR